MRRVSRVAGAAAAATLVCTFALPLPVSAQETHDSVKAEVPPGSQTDPSGAWYLNELKPGETATQSIVIGNSTDHAVEAHIEAIDAFTKSETGVGFDEPGTAPDETGAWVVVKTPVITLQSGEERAVEFTVTAPDDAEPGEYLAGLGAYVPAPADELPQVPDGAAGISINVQPRRIIAVQVNVPGDRAPLLAVTGARPTATHDGVALLITMANQGNAFTKGTGTIRVPSTDLSTDFDIDTFVSHTQIDFRVPWTKNVKAGRHAVSAQLRYGDGKTVNWNGTVDINAGMADQLQNDLDQFTVPSDDGFPIALIVVAGLLITGLLLGGAFLMRRRRQAEGTGSGPDLAPLAG